MHFFVGVQLWSAKFCFSESRIIFNEPFLRYSVIIVGWRIDKSSKDRKLSPTNLRIAGWLSLDNIIDSRMICIWSLPSNVFTISIILAAYILWTSFFSASYTVPNAPFPEIFLLKRMKSLVSKKIPLKSIMKNKFYFVSIFEYIICKKYHVKYWKSLLIKRNLWFYKWLKTKKV